MCICYNFRGDHLISAGEDGLVMLWDVRTNKAHNKLEPHTNEKVVRPDIGKWIGSAALGEDWIVSRNEVPVVPSIVVISQTFLYLMMIV